MMLLPAFLHFTCIQAADTCEPSCAGLFCNAPMERCMVSDSRLISLSVGSVVKANVMSSNNDLKQSVA